MNDVVDTEPGLDTSTPPTGGEALSSSQTSEIQPETNEVAPEAPASTPFASGKEKFKINGEEVEWDWETTKRYAQIGKAGYSAMERAKEIEKKAEKAYQELLKAAQSNPLELITLLNPNFKPPQMSGAEGSVESEALDPRDLELRELKDNYEKLSQSILKQEIEKERAAIQLELKEIQSKFPSFQNEIFLDYLKAQYKAALEKGLDVSLEDVAFHVDQKISQFESQKQMNLKKRLDVNREKSTVKTLPAKEHSQKPMSLDDVKRLAGRL